MIITISAACVLATGAGAFAFTVGGIRALRRPRCLMALACITFAGCLLVFTYHLSFLLLDRFVLR
jgi:hypothetical protein